VIVLIAREVLIGVTMVVTEAAAVEPLVEVMPLTVKWRYARYLVLGSMESMYTDTAISNSCKNCLEVLQVKMAKLLAASKPAPTRVTTTGTLSRGSVDHPPVMWLLGSREAETTAVTTMDRVTKEVRLHGHRAVEEIMDMTRMVATEPPVLHPGSSSNSKLHPRHRVGRLRIVMALMVDMPLLLVWELPGLLRAWERRLLHQACHLCITAPVAVHHPLLLVKGHLLLYVSSDRMIWANVVLTYATASE
jgi:hypothetical protein